PLIAEAWLLFLLLVRRRAGKAIGALGLCVLVALMVLPSGYGQRLSTILDVDSDATGSAQQRWRDTEAAIQFIAAHPIVGAGIGEGGLALNEVRGTFWLPVHNAYLNYGVDLGVPGLVMFVALVLTSLQTARRVERTTTGAMGTELGGFASGIRISLAGFIVAAFFHPVAYHFYFYYIAGLSVALKTVAARQFRAV